MFRILLAEDDPYSSFYIKQLAETHGICHAVANGKKAVDAYVKAIKENEPFNLILLDITMPVMDGLSALEAIRKIEEETDVPEDKKTPIVIISALDDFKTIEKAFSLKCQAFLSKPLIVQQFYETMTTYLDDKG